VTVQAVGGALGVGASITGTNGGVTFRDGLTNVDPDVFNGAYIKYAASGALGGGWGVGMTQLGGAISDISQGSTFGLDASGAAIYGKAWVTHKLVLFCDCNTKDFQY
jgi:hypothetical protein